MPSHTTDTLLAALQSKACYPHATANIRVIHTHISTIFLTGEFAYKIKKPVNFGFLDFTHLAARKHFCEEELRLNRILAPQLYLAVIAITQTVDGTYHVCQAGDDPADPVVEFAVKMRQFDPDQQFDQLLARHALALETMEKLAQQVAHFHQHANHAPADSPFGLATTLFQPMQQNFQPLRSALHDSASCECLSLLENWTKQEYLRLLATLTKRKQQGYTRACHGDMHVGNIALVNQEILIFDCIEFNDDFRWIDIASEVAFLIMDLESRNASAFANRFLNNYLNISGDYALLSVLNFYKVYRALVRAKVASLRYQQLQQASTTDPAAVQNSLQQCQAYLTLATHYTTPRQPALIITHGLSGSGKSYGCQQLVDALGWIQIRSDVERKRIAIQSTDVDAPALYSASRTAQTYDRLFCLAQDILHSGYSVVVDATFLDYAQRERFRQLAKTLHTPFCLLHFTGTPAQLARNIEQRLAAGHDVSDADLGVLQQQLRHYQPLRDDEPCVTVPNREPPPIVEIVAQINRSCTNQAN